MSDEQFRRIRSGSGFIAALDQSGGSTPKALRAYGIADTAYADDDEMFAIMHEMRSRIIASPSFSSQDILGAILFQDTIDRTICGQSSIDYLWGVKGIVPFLKIDKGLAEVADGVQLMRPIPDLDPTLARAKSIEVFGTKMRSFIKLADHTGINAVVDQQFDIAQQVLDAHLVPIVEPEVDIHSPQKAEAERLLEASLLDHLERLDEAHQVIIKLTLPEHDDLYTELVRHPKVLRVLALSGGYDRTEADARLARNHGVIASFSRGLTEGLFVDQSDESFDAVLQESIASIARSSRT